MNLRWNTSEYGGVKDLRIPPHRLWKPGTFESSVYVFSFLLLLFFFFTIIYLRRNFLKFDI